MGFQLVGYDILKESIEKSVEALIVHHKKSEKIQRDKIMESVKHIPDDIRRGQVIILLTAINLLDTDASKKNADKRGEEAYVLNALSYYLYQVIKKSYDAYKLVRSPENSQFFSQLQTALGLTKENEPNQDELLNMYKALNLFFRKHLYKEGNPMKGYLDQQVFDKKLKIEKILLDLSAQIATLDQGIITAAQEKYKKLAGDKPSGLFGGLFGGSKASSSAVAFDPSEQHGAGI